MRRKLRQIMVLLGVVSLVCLAACTKTEENNKTTENSERTVVTEDNSENVAETEDTEEKEERLNPTKYENLPKVVEQVGYSFRAPEELTTESKNAKFKKFSISEEVEEVNGMKLAKPCSTVSLHYEMGMAYFDVIIFPYEGLNIKSSHNPDVCDLFTEKINGIDVQFSASILRIVPPDYELTDEDKAFIDSGRGAYSNDGAVTSLEEIYFYSPYWVQDGIYYDMHIVDGTIDEETVKQLVTEFMSAQAY